MKRSWIGLVAMAFLWGGMPVWAQSSGGAAAQQEESGTAVKLGNGAKLINTIVWGNQNQKQVEWEAGATVDTARCKIMNDPNTLDKSLYFVDSANYDFRLSDTSSCIDYGDNARVTGNPAFYDMNTSLELWGNKRFSRGKRETNQSTGSQPKIVDCGAYEYTTYQVIFIKPEQVHVQTIREPGESDVDPNWACDSNAVRPGHSYTFVVDFTGIEGMAASMVRVWRLTGGSSEEMHPDGDNHYVITNINSDVTVEITVTPPIFVDIVPPEGGTLKATKSDGLFVPSTDETKWSMVVDENSAVRVDAVADKGYTLSNVWKEERAKEATDYGSKQSIKTIINRDNGLAITDKNVRISASFTPNDYNVVLKVNDGKMGKLLATTNEITAGKDSTETGAGPRQKTMKVKFASDRTVVPVAKTNAEGYRLVSLKVYNADESVMKADLTHASDKTISLDDYVDANGQGGMVIKAEFEPKKYTVWWDCSHGNLSVAGYTPTARAEGGWTILNQVPYEQTISVTAVPDEGYELVQNSLKARPSTGSEVDIAGGSYQVMAPSTELVAQFQKRRYVITIQSEGIPGGQNFYSTLPTGFVSGGTKEHGSSLEVIPAAVTGYNCSGIDIDGTDQGTTSGVSLTNITGPHTVTLHFERKSYQLTYTNLTPDYGTLQLVRTPKEGNAETFSPSDDNPHTHIIRYEDKIEASVTAERGYHLKSLKINQREYKDNLSNARVGSVSGDVTVEAEFEPNMYTVTLKVLNGLKDGVTYVQGKGTVALEGSKGMYKVEVLKSATPQEASLSIPFGTEMSFRSSDMECNYQVDIVNDNNQTSWLGGEKHVIESDLVVEVGIKYATENFSFDWEIDQPTSFSNTVSATWVNTCKSTTENVNQGVVEIPSGTTVSATATKQTGSVLLWVRRNSATGGDVVFTENNGGYEFAEALNVSTKVYLKYVALVTVTFQNVVKNGVTLATMEVWRKDGTSWVTVTNGNQVPAGTELRARLTAVSGTLSDDSKAGCTSLTVTDGGSVPAGGVGVDGSTFNWTAERASAMTDPVASSGYRNYTIPERYAGTEVVFAGDAERYYYVKFTQSVNGRLGVTVGSGALAADNTYWYKADTSVIVTAEEHKTGYELKGAYLNNRAYTSSPKDTLQLGGTAPNYTRTLSLDRNLDLQRTFEKKIYRVTFRKEVIPAGQPVSSGVGAVWTIPNETAIDWPTTTAADEVVYNIPFDTDLSFEATIPDASNYEVLLMSGYTPAGEKTAFRTCVNGRAETVNIQDTITYIVRFSKKYRIYWETADAPHSVNQVTNENGAVLTSNPSFVGVGAQFRVWSQEPQEGMECTRMVLVNNEDLTDTIYDTDKPGVDADNVFVEKVIGTNRSMQLAFRMPAKDVKAVAYYAKMRFNLTVICEDVEGNTATTYEVRKGATPGSGVLASGVLDGGDHHGTRDLEYGDKLWMTVTLPPSATSADTSWYEVEIRKDGKQSDKRVHVEMGVTKVDLSAIVGKLTRDYRFPVDANEGVKNHVTVTIRVIRRTQKLHLRVTPADDVFCIHLNVDGNGVKDASGHWRHFRNSDYLDVPVGAEVQAWTFGDPNVPVGWELKKFYEKDPAFYTSGTNPGYTYEAATETYTMTHAMPDNEGNIAAVWGLKEYKLRIEYEPRTGAGSVRVTDKENVVYVDNSSIKHGTELRILNGDILFLPSNADPSYTLESITAVKGEDGVTPITVTETVGGDYTFPPLTGDMTVKVKFHKIPVLTVAVANVSDVKVTDENGVERFTGSKVTVGTGLSIHAEKKGYICTSVTATHTVDGQEVVRTWSNTATDGSIDVPLATGYEMPDADVIVAATYEPKKYTVTVVFKPKKEAFTHFELKNAGTPTDNLVETFQMDYGTELSFDSLTTVLHDWYDNPVTVTAEMLPYEVKDPAAVGSGEQTTFNLIKDKFRVENQVTVTVTAKRKQKLLFVVMDEEDRQHFPGNEVRVVLENGKDTTYLESDITHGLTVDVGARVVITARPAGMYRVSEMAWRKKGSTADDGTGTGVTMTINEMPDVDATATVKFLLKEYTLTVVIDPTGAGTVALRDRTSGVVYTSGDKIKHGTRLIIPSGGIVANPPADPAHKLTAVAYSFAGKVSVVVERSADKTYEFPQAEGDMTIMAHFVRMPKLFIAPDNIGEVEVWSADGQSIPSNTRVEEGTVLRIKAAKEGHDCMRLVATVDGNVEYKKWTECDANGVIEVTVGEGFAMPGKDMTISAAFEPKKYDVTVVYVPSKAAFTGFDLLVNPHAADEQRKKLEDAFQMTYTSVLALDADSVALHPWYEGPVTATAVMEGNQGVTYDLMAGDQISVKGHVTVTVTAKRKQKTLYVEISEEAPEHGGNAVEVWLEDGTKTTLTQTDLVGITVDVGSKVVIQGVPAAVYTMPNEEAVVWDPREGHIPGGASPVGTKQVVIAEMPDTDVDATATFELKRYNVAMRIDGYGTMDVTGLLGKSGMSVDEVHLKSGKNDHDNTDRSVAHYRQLHITVAPRTPAYRLTSFTIGGRQVATSDTTIEVTGNVKILAQYTKYYKVEWETNTGRGDMYVLPRGEETADTCYPGYTEFTVGVDAQEGYRVKGIAWTGSSEECSKEGTVEIADNKGKYTLPPLTEDACYDTVRLRAEMEVIPCRLKVEVPEEDGWVTVAAGGQTVDVPAAGVVLDYWTELDITSGIHIPEGYKLDKMVIIDGAGNQKTYPLTNGQNQPIHWTMKGDATVRLLIEPHMYKVNFVQPEFGRMTVRDVKADTLLKSGDEVMYRTPLLITVEPDDPVGYEIIRTSLKTCNYDGQLVPAEESDEMNRYDWEVKCDVEMISAVIQIRRWQVKWTIVAQDEDGHVIMDPNDQRLPAGEVEVILPDGTAVPHTGSPLTVDHYTVLRVSVRAFEKAKAIFKLNALEVDGAELETRDSSFMVEGNVAITVTFRMRQPYRFPVAFTPNGDQWNQTWKIDGFWQANREKNKLEIYNRAQQRIYKAQPFDNENGWEGVTDDGDIVPAGTYVYIFEDGEGEKFTGLVSVVRN